MSTNLLQMAAAIVERSRTLINNDLKKICKEEGVAQSGNKAVLQARVADLIDAAVYRADAAEALRRLQYRVHHGGNAPRDAPPFTPVYAPPPPARTHSTTTSSSSHSPTAPSYAAGYNMPGRYSNNPVFASLHQPQMPPRPQYFFKDSPFFEIRELVLGNIALEASPSHRQNCTRNLILTDAQCARLKADPSLRLLLYGATEQPLAQFTRLDIAFPSQFEVRINSDEVKANFKGLKNKPGSTRPADLTDKLRIAPANYRNVLVFTYALTQKASQPPEKFNLFVYMARQFSIDELTQRIKTRNVITRQSVLNEMREKANDADIEVGPTIMSLKDPISTSRINTPCRSTVCTHNQCFDAESFLQLQDQAPTWTCPICNKALTYEGLAVDQYVEEILCKVQNADHVTIQPNGEWSTDNVPMPPSNNGYSRQDDSDDDLLEISHDRTGLAALGNQPVPTPVFLNTPPIPSRETSTAPRPNNKRPSEVVDLTLSDDDEPVRPTKKVAYNTPNTVPDRTRRYQHPPPAQSADHSRFVPPYYTPTMRSNSRHDFSRTPSTPPDRPAYTSYRLPPPPASRPPYPGYGTSQNPAWLSSSP